MNKQEMLEKLGTDPMAMAAIAGTSVENINKHLEQTRRMSRGQTPSRPWKNMLLQGQGPEGITLWKNDLYEATLRVYNSGWPISNGSWAQIGIWTRDGNARHDWRDFQRIKNDLVSEDWEALELYPSEKRLLDPSNYYILYAAPKLPFGKYEGRTILGPENCAAPQRGWAKGDEPPELRKKPL